MPPHNAFSAQKQGTSVIEPSYFRHFSVAEGLSQVTVSDIVQDRLGFMWFSTQNGLNRFDGYQFVQFNKDKLANGAGPIGEFTYKLALDGQSDDIWIATSGGLSRYLYDADTFRHYPLTGDDDEQRYIVSTVIVDEFDDVWVGSRQGLFRFNRGSDQFESVTLPINKATRVLDIFRLSETSVLVATTNSLWHVPLTSSDKPALVKAGLEFTDIEQLDTQQIWISTLEGELYEVILNDDGAVDLNRVDIQAPRLSAGGFTSIKQISNGDVWINSQAGLAILRADAPDNVHALYFENSAVSILSSAHMTRTFEANSGLIWQGSWTGGVSVFDPNSIYIKYLNAEPYTTVRGLALDDEEALWFGTPMGIWKRSPSGSLEGPWVLSTGTEMGNSAAVNAIRSMAFDFARQQFWIGTTGGLFVLPLGQAVATKLEVLSGVSIFHLTLDNQGDVWIGTVNHGLYHINGSSLATEHHWPLSTVTHIYATSADAVYAGSIEGLIKVDKSTYSLQNLHDEPSNEINKSPRVVTWVSPSTDGHFWIGSQGSGVFKMESLENGYTFEQLVPDEHLSNLSVGGVQEDEQGSLWVSTTEGIAQLTENNTRVYYYNDKNGAKTEGYYINHSVKASSGEIVFGGPVGISHFYPEQVKRSEWSPNVVLTNLMVLNKVVRPQRQNNSNARLTQPVHIAKQLTLGPDDNVFSINFSALDFGSPEDNGYAYQLEGFDSDWVLTSAKHRIATYTNLDPGQYRLVVKGTNSDGMWSEKQALLTIAVQPPWYWTSWAKVAWILSISWLVFSLYQWRTTALKQRSRELELLVEARTRDLEESNQKLLRLSSIDELTGLRNRRDFRQRAFNELERFKRTGRVFSILMLDIDGFKQINDEKGHACGDKVLVDCAAKMLSIIRESDLLARWGGEEFIILAADTELDAAVVLAEKIRSEMAAHDIEFENHTIRVHFTIGVAQIAEGQCLDECINEADKHMYAGKVDGKNQTRHASS